MNTALHNPAFNALTTGNSHLAKGTGEVRYFDPEVSPIVGLARHDGNLLNSLHEQIADDSPRVVFTPEEIHIPSSWKLLRFISGYQMVHNNPVAAANNGSAATLPLTHEHIPQMLELTKLTAPGPFDSRTIEFGYYEGVFDGNKVVAMAGQRMNPGQYTEISAVCTHPDYLGRGYARQLLLSQVNRMNAAGNIPFLHVRDDNERAINVYKSLGFEISSVMNFYFIKKA
ncbi:GNAT family N-acetyltransferase [Mucilaginibacter terrae]|uniref:Ribosomal protein S18 acetylase RimI-like enzyme n=1 Tax=Mucilaginibacter terrae TaxID=1955052 RepID=A0ABU3GY73_9SPHI|nr:GNAT family N-acetyltransferase [Mucilaginibacter terrae]MDT3404718.1 ribosomal protein S18 acetylase RimI-like enzyme [Mucilaginibacter terrae]